MKRDPKAGAEAVADFLIRLGETNPAALTRLVEWRRKRPDAIDRLGDLLRENRAEAQALLKRVIEAVQEEPSFGDVACELVTWRHVPYVDILFRGEPTGGRREEGPLVRFKKALDASRVEVARELLEKWDRLVPSVSGPMALQRFLMEEWNAGRYPYTKEEIAAMHLVRPEATDGGRPGPFLLPFFATALYRMQEKRDKAFLGKGDARKAGVSTKRLAAWIVLSATGRANDAPAVRRLLSRIEKRVPPK